MLMLRLMVEVEELEESFGAGLIQYLELGFECLFADFLKEFDLHLE